MRLATISYETNSTVILGTQHERLNVHSGLDRRLFILDCTPGSKDRELYIDAFVNGTGIAPDLKRITKLRNEFTSLSRVSVDKLDLDRDSDFYHSVGSWGWHTQTSYPLKNSLWVTACSTTGKKIRF
jgi:hypothetical protein